MESESTDRSLEELFRCKKADLVMVLMCDWKERVESRMTPRLWTPGEGWVMHPSTLSHWE